jgi:GTP cyclohydrolase I
MDLSEKSVIEGVVNSIKFIGDDPEREGLVETPARVLKSFKTIYGGYGQDPKDVMKIFEDGKCEDMVILKDIEFFSTCEHHMLPFFGKAHIAYIPDKCVIGISKLARLLEIYARRLQIQERICQQVTTALMEHLKPLGAACILEAQHFCMTSRGVQKQNSIMVTSSLTGEFRDNAETRSELMSLIK